MDVRSELTPTQYDALKLIVAFEAEQAGIEIKKQ